MLHWAFLLVRVAGELSALAWVLQGYRPPGAPTASGDRGPMPEKVRAER